MKFVGSVLIKIYFISFVFFDISVVWFHSFPFSFFTDLDFIFCWSSKNPWVRSGGILVFKVVFLFSAFLKIFRAESFFHGGSNFRVLEARGLAGLARRLAGVAGRRMEQRSLARSMLWKDRRITFSYISTVFHNIHGSLWILMSIHGYPWTFMNIHGYFSCHRRHALIQSQVNSRKIVLAARRLGANGSQASGKSQ